MSVVVTLNIFSGRPDPSWELTAEQARELVARLKGIGRATLMKPPGIVGGLGYRGFTITSIREASLDPEVYVHRGIVDFSRFDVNRIADNVDLEHWLLATATTMLDEGIRRTAATAIDGAATMSLPETSFVVPDYDPGKWNNDPTILRRNNCYNYANDKITNTFAQPGRGSGTMYGAINCSEVGAAAQRDGQVPVGSASSTPAQGRFVALVIWPGADYHWYRLDANTRWSHKPGGTPARNTDNSGQLISDPQTCNRGNYTVWCGYFHCVPANTKIL